jgi:hypothetical protein
MNTTPTESSRPAAALVAVRQLVEAMELDDVPIERCLMLAQRVARLLRDGVAQNWLDLEQRGYPEVIPAGELGYCGKYAFRFGADNKTVVRASLPQLEAMKRATEMVLAKTQVPAISGVAENFLAAGATKEIIKAVNFTITNAEKEAIFAAAAYARLRAALHRWAADTLIALELGNAAEGIFVTRSRAA